MLFNPKQNSENLPRSVFVSIWMKRLPLFIQGGKPALIVVPPWICQLVKFGLVGVLNTLVDAGAYFLLSRSGLVSSFVLAKGISYLIGMLNSFYWNKSWTFKSRLETRQIFLTYVAANLLAVGLNTWVMYLALESFGLPESGALTLATAVTFFWNFAISKFFIFK